MHSGVSQVRPSFRQHRAVVGGAHRRRGRGSPTSSSRARFPGSVGCNVGIGVSCACPSPSLSFVLFLLRIHRSESTGCSAIWVWLMSCAGRCHWMPVTQRAAVPCGTIGRQSPRTRKAASEGKRLLGTRTLRGSGLHVEKALIAWLARADTADAAGIPGASAGLQATATDRVINPAIDRQARSRRRWVGCIVPQG